MQVCTITALVKKCKSRLGKVTFVPGILDLARYRKAVDLGSLVYL
jgi:hypothetical protein